MTQDETMESLDQPLEEESQDQPDVESDDELTFEDDDDQPLEESEESEEEIPVDELKAGYLRQQDYTRKTQEIAKMRKEIEEMKGTLSAKSKPSRTPEEEQALQTLKKLSVVTEDHLDAKLEERINALIAKQEMERDKTRLGVDDDVLSAARFLQKSKRANGEEISIDDALSIMSQGTRSKKVLRRKTVGTKGGVTAKPGRASDTITIAELKKLDPSSDKYAKAISKWKSGKLKILPN